jgi:hypothetical protein
MKSLNTIIVEYRLAARVVSHSTSHLYLAKVIQRFQPLSPFSNL